MPAPDQFPNVTAVTRANVYFGGKVVSHSILFPDGSKKTLGLVFPGKYHFGTEKAELMEITDGSCTVVMEGPAPVVKIYAAGSEFRVPAKSGFHIEVVEGALCQYVCSFLD